MTLTFEHDLDSIK